MNINSIANKYENWKLSFKRHSFLQLTDNQELVIDNCREVIKYDENIIEMLLVSSKLQILGTSLRMSNFSTDGVIVRGHFDTLKFIDNKGK